MAGMDGAATRIEMEGKMAELVKKHETKLHELSLTDLALLTNEKHQSTYNRLIADLGNMRSAKDALELDKNNEIERQRSNLGSEILKLQKEVKGLLDIRCELEARVSELQLLLAKLSDAESNLNVIRQNRDSIEVAKCNLHTELTNASAYIIELEDKFYKQQCNALELLKQLKFVEETNEEITAELHVLR